MSLDARLQKLTTCCFSTLTHNSQPLHLDAEAAKHSEFGQIIVNSTFTFSLLVGISVGQTTMGTLVANLGFTDVVTPNPVFIGDTLVLVLRLKKNEKANLGQIVALLPFCMKC